MTHPRDYNDADSRLATHRRGGLARWHGRELQDDWRAKYGAPPMGDPNRAGAGGRDDQDHAEVVGASDRVRAVEETC